METSYPIEHWSYSSLVAYLRNPLAWYKRYVEKIYDLPSGPAGVIGRAGHKALEFVYKGGGKEEALQVGLEYLRSVPDFEINFGVAESVRAKKAKRQAMEKEYQQAVGFYFKRLPQYNVLGVEVSAKAHVPGVPIPIKAISDLVVESKDDTKALDIVDHKFVDSFSTESDKPLFMLQALFNYYTVREEYGREIKRFVFQECKKKRNRNGKSQMKKHVIHFDEHQEDFDLFHRLLSDVTRDMSSRKVFLPNPSDMFEGKNSFEIYRMGL